jgi:homoserine O-succinyltransferase
MRVGVINLMPHAERYEPSLVGALEQAGFPLEFAWIRLASHGYRSSDPAHLKAHYQSFESALEAGPLDALILTGAPIETLPFDEVRYWPELSAILLYARRSIRSTLGLCWGALALAKLEGIEKTTFSHKLFGVFDHGALRAEHPLLASASASVACPQSRHAGIDDAVLEAHARDGRVDLLTHAAGAGYSLFATADLRFVMQLGHPEYELDRIGFEWQRDRSLGRSDVSAPLNCDAESGAPRIDWRASSRAFFRDWLAFVASASLGA